MIFFFFWIPSGRNSWGRLLYKLNFPERIKGYAIAEIIIPYVFPSLGNAAYTKLSLGSRCIYMLCQ